MMINVVSGTPWRRYFAVAFAAIHLAIVSFFAFSGLDDSDDVQLPSQVGFVKVLAEAITFYGNWSGTGTSYGYFAPGVSLAPRTRLQIVNSSGGIFEHILQVDQFDIGLRVATIATAALNSKQPYIFARSLAAMVFDREEKAERVKVIFDRLVFPNFQEATEGELVSWTPAYSAEFVKNGNELICLC